MSNLFFSFHTFELAISILQDEHPTLPFRTLALGEVTKNEEGEDEDVAPKAVVDFLKGVSGLEVAETKKIAFGDDVSASLKKLSITVSVEKCYFNLSASML